MARPLDPSREPARVRDAVLLLPLHAASLREMSIIARAMVDDGRYRPVMLLRQDGKYADFGGELQGLEVIRWYGSSTTPVPHAPAASDESDRSRGPAPPSLARLRRRILTVLGDGTLFALLEYLVIRRKLKSDLARARQLVASLQPRAVFLSGDRNILCEAGLIQASREAGVLTVVVPFAYSGRDDVAFMRRDLPANRMDAARQRALKSLVARRHPAQVYDSPYGAVLFLRPAVTLAMARLDMLPPQPWAMGGGLSDVLAVAGEDDRERSVAVGVPAGKIVVTGEPSHDALYRARQRRHALREEIRRRHALEASRPLLVCAVPQLAEHSIVSWERHWQEVRFLVGELCRMGAHVLLSLHPKSDPSRYRFLETELGAHILDTPLRDSLPAADVFVGTFTSTVRWSALLGIPTVVVDFYDFDYDMFDDLPGVTKVDERSELGPSVRRALDHAGGAPPPAERLRGMAPFDGHANRRLIDLIGTWAR